MTAFFFDHLPGCTPLRPCASCITVGFLRRKLSESDFNELVAEIRKGTEIEESYGPTNPAPLDSPIAILSELTIRSKNCLENDNIRTLGELTQKTRAELLRAPNFGRRSLREIEDALARVGRRLSGI